MSCEQGQWKWRNGESACPMPVPLRRVICVRPSRPIPPSLSLYLDALLSKETLFERNKVSCKLSLLQPFQLDLQKQKTSKRSDASAAAR